MKDLVGVILLSSLVALFIFYELPFVTLKTAPYMFRAELYWKRLKEFEASGFPSCILNNAHFFETSHKNQKGFTMSGKVGTFSKQNGIWRRYFFLMRILYTKLQSCSLCYRETNWFMQKIPSVTGIICANCQNYNICMQ